MEGVKGWNSLKEPRLANSGVAEGTNGVAEGVNEADCVNIINFDYSLVFF